MNNPLTFLIIGFIISVIGALPFGLVNLTVLNVAYKKGNSMAMNISHGAAIVEVLFGLIAILTGNLIHQFINENIVINYFIIAVLSISGLLFIIKRRKEMKEENRSKTYGFFKGVLLNMVSFQVLLFWLIAITFLSSRQIIEFNIIAILTFIMGIWIGKMAVLCFYILLSHKIISRSRILSKNIDKMIGIVLFIIAAIQIVQL